MKWRGVNLSAVMARPPAQQGGPEKFVDKPFSLLLAASIVERFQDGFRVRCFLCKACRRAPRPLTDDGPSNWATT